MSTKSTMRISVPALAVRLNWTSLEDLPYSADVILEIVQRYCDSQDHAKTYRLKAAAKQRLLKSRLSQLAQASGMSVEEYLEAEEETLSAPSGQ